MIPAYSCPFPIIISTIQRTSTTALAAIAISLSRSQPPNEPTPTQQVVLLKTRLPYATTPIVVFDKDYATRIPSTWQFHTNPEPQPQPPPPPPPPPPKSQREAQQHPQRVERSQLHLPPRPYLSTELRILTRLLVALVVGGIIGMERRAANSLAGVRTFSLVSLGAAIFMSTTLVSFPKADPTRVAAAISSGVGFLGAGAMHKDPTKHSRGLTTASSVWLAAALGIAAACGMFLLSFMGAISTVLIARYARFDSSLHLIRGDPLGDLDGFEIGRGVGYGKDVYELQSIVDFDPSSQTGYSEWRGHGKEHQHDISQTSKNGNVEGNQMEDR